MSKVLLPYVETEYFEALFIGYERIPIDGHFVGVGARIWRKDGEDVWYTSHTRESYSEVVSAMNAEDEALEKLGYKLLNDIDDADKYRILL